MCCICKRGCLYAYLCTWLHGCCSPCIGIYHTHLHVERSRRPECPSRVLAWLRRDNYEITKGIAPGTIVNNWVTETAAFIKTLDKNHMARALPLPCYLLQCGRESMGHACLAAGKPAIAHVLCSLMLASHFACNMHIILSAISASPAAASSVSPVMFVSKGWMSHRRLLVGLHAPSCALPLMYGKTGMRGAVARQPRELCCLRDAYAAGPDTR